jgi:Mg/Co/Ni transporter MgtE
MKRGLVIGAIVGGILGILLAICIVWIGLIYDDSPGGLGPLIAFGVLAAAMLTGFFATVGAVIGALVAAVRT